MNMVEINVPQNFEREREYVFDVVFDKFLGIDYKISFSQRKDILLKRSGFNKSIRVFDQFFDIQNSDWLSKKNVPSDVEVNHFLGKKYIFIAVDKSKKEVLTEQKKSFFINWDLFGVIFFFLTRYEELVSEGRKDKFSRFTLKNSLSHKNGFYKTPIVDQYVFLLQKLMNKVWEGINMTCENQFTCNITHDIDYPFRYYQIPLKKAVARAVRSDDNTPVIKRVAQSVREWYSVNYSGSIDPYFNLDEIMDMSEEANTRSRFYFMTGQTSKAHDPGYSMRSDVFSKTLSEIHDRGHEIGFHPSFNTFDSSNLIQKEFSELKQVCKENGIEQERWGGRQHFLKCKVPETLRYWEQASLDYDSTLGFAEEPGFRCGTSKPFPIFDLKQRRTLNLVEYPLIVMEASVLDQRYMGLKDDLPEAFNVMKDLKDKCKKYSGIFTLLWHNNRLVKPEEKELYKAILTA